MSENAYQSFGEPRRVVAGGTGFVVTEIGSRSPVKIVLLDADAPDRLRVTHAVFGTRGAVVGVEVRYGCLLSELHGAAHASAPGVGWIKPPSLTPFQVFGRVEVHFANLDADVEHIVAAGWIY